MLHSFRRSFKVYGAVAAVVPKLFLAYSIWVWMQFFVQIIGVIIQIAFWRAVYANSPSLGGLSVDDTLNYLILAQIFSGTVFSTNAISWIGQLIRQGQIGIELLRPVDFQGAAYVRNVTEVLLAIVVQLPFALIVWFLYPYRFPTDLNVYLAFLVTLLLGNALLFFFDWALGCLAFYSTEVWGLSVIRFGIATFFSGALVPLAIMPEWLQSITLAMPFAHALYMPVSILSGLTPLEEVPAIWGLQLAYLVGFFVLSRLLFMLSVRKVTVQGG